MTSLIQAVGAACRKLCALALGPFETLPAIYGLTALSIISGILILIVFRFASNPLKIENAKSCIKSDLLKIWLYNHDLVIVLKTQVALIKDAFRYIRHTLFPLFVMAVPIIALLETAVHWYEYRPFHPGEESVVTITFNSKSRAEKNYAAVSISPHQWITSLPVRVPALGQVSWRLHALKKGKQAIRWDIDGKIIETAVIINDAIVPVFPQISKQTLQNVILNFSSPVLESNIPVESINIVYPRRRTVLFGLKIHWLVVYFVLTLIAVLALKRLFNVAL